MTTLNTIEDLARILKEQPTWAEALRALVLSGDLLELPDRVDRFIEEQKKFNDEQRQFNEDQRQFNEDQRQFNQTTDQRLNSIEGRLGNLEGGQYERNVRSRAFARTITGLGFTSPYLAMTQDTGTDSRLTSAIQSALASGRISQERISDLFEADLIISSEGNHHAVFEISMTADNDDIRRAKRRSEILTEVTGGDVRAVVITSNLRRPQRRQAEAEDVSIFIAS
ncbi:MAG: hypothetical protein F4X65_07990 [Chloroflexi bacterium]|nr:hypothetical protein [Chloroflexota bacterium]